MQAQKSCCGDGQRKKENEMQTEHPGRIALQSDIAEELHMEGDAARIHQLVSLLVDNAVKYTPEGGKIHIFWRKKRQKSRIFGAEYLRYPAGR